MLTDTWIAFLPAPGDSRGAGSRTVCEYARGCGLHVFEGGCTIAFRSGKDWQSPPETGLVLIQALPGSVRSAHAREFERLRGASPDWLGWAGTRLQLFNLIRADQHRFRLESDVLALLRYFRARIHGGLVLASSLRLLFGCFRELIRPVDRLGVAEMLAGSSPRGVRTVHQRVRSCRAGEVVRWNPQQGPRTDLERRLTAPDLDPELGNPGTLARLHQPMLEQLPRGIADPSRVLLPLTGGLDSRLIACAALEQGIDFQAVTLGLEQHREVRAARAVARTLKLKHRVAAPRRAAMSRIELWKETIEGQASAATLFIAELLDLGFPPETTLLHGLLGDVLAASGQFWVANREVSTREKVVDLIVEHFHPEPPASLLLEPGMVRSRQDYLEEVAAELPEAPAPCQSLLMWLLENEQRKLSHMVLLLGRGFHVTLPYYNPGTLRGWLAVDFPQKRKKKALLTMFRELYPSVARVPRAEDEPRFTFRSWEAARYMFWLQAHRLRFGLRRRILPGGRAIPDPTVIWGLWHDVTESQRAHEIATVKERGKSVGELLDWEFPRSPPPWELEPDPELSARLLRSHYLLTVYCEGLKEAAR